VRQQAAMRAQEELADKMRRDRLAREAKEKKEREAKEVWLIVCCVLLYLYRTL
jgi:hypothetical protein